MTLAALLTLTAPLGAQIYADFTVSKGTPPTNTPLGTIRVELAHEKAPRPVAAFIGLATGQRPWISITTGNIVNTPFYDGQIFHRLIHNFVLQGGDFLGGGQGGPGFIQQEQFHPDLRHDPYVISMAKGTLPNSAGSQFFFTLEASHHLDDKHAVFGTITEESSKLILDGFKNSTNFPTDGSDFPTTQINLDSVVISGPDLAGFDLFDPSLKLPTIRSQAIETEYLPDVDTFKLTWDWEFQTQYTLYAGTSLDPLPAFYVIYSSQPSPDRSFSISGVSFPKYFSRMHALDYGHVANPPTDLISAGRNITLSSRNGDTISLDFSSETAGTWTHSDTSSGSFTVTLAFDAMEEDQTSGFSNLTQGAIFLGQIPLFEISLDFGVPGTTNDYTGPEGWASLNVLLNFFDPQSGWTDGTAPVSGFPTTTTVFRSFTTTP